MMPTLYAHINKRNKTLLMKTNVIDFTTYKVTYYIAHTATFNVL